MQPLLTKEDAAGIMVTLARLRANAKRRQAEEAAAQEEARQAFYAAGGVCWTCLDKGYVVQRLVQRDANGITMQDTRSDTPCNECPRGTAVRAEMELRQVRAMLDASGISQRLRDFTLQSFPVPEHPALAKVVDFLTHWDEHQGLILVGSYGTGKTGMLAGLVREVATLYVAGGRPERRITWATGVELMDTMRRGIDAQRRGEDDHSSAETLDRAKKCSLLVIDDIGAEKPTPWVLERLFAIVNERYEGRRPTFITTNYGLEELAERIGPRVLERLIETSRTIEVKGPNLRRRGNGGAQ